MENILEGEATWPFSRDYCEGFVDTRCGVFSQTICQPGSGNALGGGGGNHLGPHILKETH